MAQEPLSVVAPIGGGAAKEGSVAAPVKRSALPVADERSGEPDSGKITIAEVQSLQTSGEEVILVDARADRNRRGSDVQAQGSVRLHPDDPVRDATEKRLSQRATLVVYCA
jgi:hypothetical protein